MQTCWKSPSGASSSLLLVCQVPRLVSPPQKMQHHLLTQHIPNTYLGCGPCLRAAVVATAFVSQMESEEKNLRSAKQALETALSLGQPLKDVTQKLEDANSQYRTASVQIRKHATPPKPKVAKGKAKAKAAAAANGTA